MEAALCPSDYVQTAEVSLASTVKNQSGIFKRLTASAKKSMMHRAHYNASHEILKKFPNLQIQGKKKKKIHIHLCWQKSEKQNSSKWVQVHRASLDLK